MCAWMRAQSPSVQAQFKAFPPLSLVRGTRWLESPYPWTVGYVAGYFEDRLVVVQEPGATPVHLLPSDLQLAGLWKGLSPELVSNILNQRQLSLLPGTRGWRSSKSSTLPLRGTYVAC